jgi:hypothetical protein
MGLTRTFAFALALAAGVALSGCGETPDRTASDETSMDDVRDLPAGTYTYSAPDHPAEVTLNYVSVDEWLQIVDGGEAPDEGIWTAKVDGATYTTFPNSYRILLSPDVGNLVPERYVFDRVWLDYVQQGNPLPEGYSADLDGIAARSTNGEIDVPATVEVNGERFIVHSYEPAIRDDPRRELEKYLSDPRYSLVDMTSVPEGGF